MTRWTTVRFLNDSALPHYDALAHVVSFNASTYVILACQYASEDQYPLDRRAFRNADEEPITCLLCMRISQR